MAPAKIKITRCSTAGGKARSTSVSPYDLKNPKLGDVTFDERRWMKFKTWICRQAGVDHQAHQPVLHRPGPCGSGLSRQAFNEELSDGTEFFLYHIVGTQQTAQDSVPTQSQSRNVGEQHQEAEDEQQLTERDGPAEDDQSEEDDGSQPTDLKKLPSDNEELGHEEDPNQKVAGKAGIDRRATGLTERNGKPDTSNANNNGNSNDENESGEQHPDRDPDSCIREVRNIGKKRIPSPTFGGKYKMKKELQPHAVIRVGVRNDLRLDPEDGEDGVPMEVVIVAFVWCKDQGDPTIIFREVNTWLINGVSIGDWENGHDVDDIGAVLRTATYIPDRRFKGLRTMHGLIAELHRIVANGYDAIPIDVFNRLPHSMSQQQKDQLVIARPVIPDVTQEECGDAITENSDQEEVHVVIHFRNMLTASEYFELEVNLQATLLFNETAASVRTFLLRDGYIPERQAEDDYDEGKESKESLEKEGGLWIDFELYVFSQGEDIVMYRWDNDTNRNKTANFFLDGETSRDYGRRLYLEVHIVQHPDHEAKEKARAARQKKVRAKRTQKQLAEQKTSKAKEKQKPSKGDAKTAKNRKNAA